MQDNWTISVSPHLHNRENISRIMWLVTVSLIPSGIAGVFIFGLAALRVVVFGVVSAVISEALLQKIFKRKVAVSDGSAFLTGLLLSYNLPPAVPLWVPVAGSFFAIFIGKFVFGGLGRNIFNPALAARAFLMASWPKHMTTFSYDAVTSATPLSMVKEGKPFEHILYLDLFLGRHAGCIGEVCILALLFGALFLLIKGYISWHIPVSFILTTGLFMFIFSGSSLFSGDFLFQILSGGLILGAFYMATDYVTSPITRKGQIIFGIGCGLLTAIIRIWGGYPEGVCYSILMMNAAVPLIDRYTRTRVYGR